MRRSKPLFLSISISGLMLLLSFFAVTATAEAQGSDPWFVPMPTDDSVLTSIVPYNNATYGATATCTWAGGTLSCSGVGLNNARIGGFPAGGIESMSFRGFDAAGIHGVRFQVGSRSPGIRQWLGRLEVGGTWSAPGPTTGAYMCIIAATGGGVDSNWWGANCDRVLQFNTLDDFFINIYEGTTDGGPFSISFSNFEVICTSLSANEGLCARESEAPRENIFGLTCSYTGTTGIPQTVSASNVLNASFEVFNYGSLPAGWSVNSPGSTFFAAQNISFDGNFSLQYRPNASRFFAQACRSIQIDTDAQSVAAGVHYAGGGSGTSDVSIILDGIVLGTTTVSEAANWTALPVTATFSSVTQFHTLCIEVEGANHAYIDAVWLYASESSDLGGLICPAPADDIAPPPPPPQNDEDGIPVPAPDDIGTCYRCIKPLTILQIGSWIKWLYCGLANLFRCELWLWLLRLQNIVAAIFGSFGVFIAWMPSVFQSGIDWGGNTIGSVASWFVGIWNAFRNGFTLFLSGLIQRFLETELVQDIWSVLTAGRGIVGFLVGLLHAFMAMLTALYDAVLQLIELIRSFVVAIATAWNAEPYQFDFIPGQGGAGGLGPGIADPGLLEAEGANNSKIYWLIIVSLLTIDDVAGQFGLQYLQWLAMGILSLGVIGWTFTKWHDPVPT